jgi:hypothetical protein
MSIYGTFLSIEDERQTAAELKAAGINYGIIDEQGEVEDLNTLPAEMLDAPIVYQGSHILPSERDERGGSVELASIGGFVERNGRESEKPDDDALWPYLRLNVLDQDGVAAVVLTAEQTKRLFSSLGEWLNRLEQRSKEAANG